MRTPELRNKILFVLALIAIYRLGVFIPTPGFDYRNVNACIDQSMAGGGGVLGIVNMFSGGALLQMSIFALGVMPYITASIIVQLLRVVIPRFEELHKEGQSGQAQLTQYTRYLTVGLAVLQSTTIITLVRSGQFFQGCTLPLVPDQSALMLSLMILTMTAGTIVIMWFGELMTEKGVGNGMSLLIFTSIAAGFPGSLGQILKLQGWLIFGLVFLVGLVLCVLIIYVEQSQRRIPVQYAKRQVGRRLIGGSSTYIPIKVNQAGVIPVIFASSLLALPQLATTFGNPNDGWVQWIQTNLTQGNGFSWVYSVTFFLMVVFFAFFYVSITFNPEEIADNMKKYGGFIPGIRAGKPTERYLQYVINRVLSVGAVYLGVLALIPILALAFLGADQNFPFGGVSLLIIIGVGLDTVKQISAKLHQHHYEGIL
ncbi:preprotein translocase subunit SecY [Helcobacillus massiliensis]|nr:MULTISPECIES: preprotein translocase subunit SecY [Helcobacillus]MCG7426222.1 preprotein translocase subunit SecY [Helcobacillus sp. ACRRO]MCT1558562.1 preprotein translocase subunit SecY [Helcobacillus massiliensis]MCT2037212.1 preprotein translocase subunit SecY [Helcobacillus massiliensis]MCT2332386.1 preprotein translocase subunit SecY [Helcobacillus massiliensis]MDK7742587.1 preprotein translocase subunit SecY [Helcobacillus massiliensis]